MLIHKKKMESPLREIQLFVGLDGRCLQTFRPILKWHALSLGSLTYRGEPELHF